MRQSDRLLKAILVWTAITMITLWLPLIRGLMDGASYSWGWTYGIGGQGLGGDYWLLVLITPFALGLLYLGWQGARRPFHWLLLLWHLPLGAHATWLSLSQPAAFRFRGDTLGVDFSLAWIGPLLFGGFALLGVAWVIRDLHFRRTPAAEAPGVNRSLFWVVAAMLPIQFVLLRFGEPHGTTDQVGVLLTLLQWLLLNRALVPPRGAATPSAPAVALPRATVGMPGKRDAPAAQRSIAGVYLFQ